MRPVLEIVVSPEVIDRLSTVLSARLDHALEDNRKGILHGILKNMVEALSGQLNSIEKCA